MSEENNKDGANGKPDNTAGPGNPPASGKNTPRGKKKRQGGQSGQGRKPDTDKPGKPGSSSAPASEPATGTAPPASTTGQAASGGKTAAGSPPDAGKPDTSTSAPTSETTPTSKPAGSSKPAGLAADQSPSGKPQAGNSESDHKPNPGGTPDNNQRVDQQASGAKTAKTSTVERAGKQAASDQQPRDSGATDKIAKDRQAIDQRVKDQATRDQAAKERAARFQSAREQDGSQADKSKPAPTSASSKSPASSGSARSPQPGTGGGSGRGTPAAGAGGRNGNSASLAFIVAVVALILAVIAAGAAGLLWYRGQTQLAAMNTRVDTVEQGMQSNVQKVVMPRLSKMGDRVQSLSSDVSGLSDQVGKRKQQVDQLQKKLQAVQAKNAELAGRVDGTHTRFTEQRVQSLLQAANQRLTIYKDPKAAMQALKLADKAIEQAGDPRLSPVRKDIANEIAAVKALPNSDTEGLSLKLSNLIDQIPDMPLDNNVPSEYSSSGSKDKAGQSGGQGGGQSNGKDGDQQSASFTDRLAAIDVAGGWQHFVDSISNAMSHMVTIRRSSGSEDAPALMAPDQSYFLTQNLQLQLRSAQLALLDRDTQTYRSNLSSARDWIKQYYAGNDSSVKAALDTLDQLSNVKLDWQAPDITASLETLRQIMSRSDDSGAAGQDQSKNQGQNQGQNQSQGDNGGSEQ